MVLDESLGGTVPASAILAGMEVCGVDGDRVGVVKEVRTFDFLVDRAMKRDLYVPVDAVREIRDDVVVLRAPANDVDDMGWERPPLTG